TATTESIGTANTALDAARLDAAADDSILLVTVTGTENPGNGWGIGALCYNVEGWPNMKGGFDVNTPDGTSLEFTVSYSIGAIKAARAASEHTDAGVVVNAWSSFSVKDISIMSFTF
ncbi:MAG: hypothetical protein LBH75_07705, partial [Treponema sp.]|nr:hypothetical protein [Treponema sp.]